MHARALVAAGTGAGDPARPRWRHRAAGQAARAIRRCLTADGTWLIKEIRAGETWQDNLAHPVAAMFYGTSVASCLPSGLSDPDGAGLGTLGLPPSALERMCRDAGFSRFQVHDVGDPANLYYEVKP